MLFDRSIYKFNQQSSVQNNSGKIYFNPFAKRSQFSARNCYKKIRQILYMIKSTNTVVPGSE